MGANAVTSVPTYVDGEVLEASRLNVTNSGIPVFATTTTRDAAFGGTGEKTLAEGQMAYIEASKTTQYFDGASWKTLGPSGVIQVKAALKTDTFSTNAQNSWTDITGLSVSITPTSTSNQIVVVSTVSGTGYTVGIAGIALKLVRDTTTIAVGDAAGSRIRATSTVANVGNGVANPYSMSAIDSPATTSAVTYKVQAWNDSPGNVNFFCNRSVTDSDNASHFRTSSCIIVYEVTP